MNDVFTGKLIRLAAWDPEEMSKTYIRWNLNSEFQRLLNSSPEKMLSAKSVVKWMKEEIAEMSPGGYYFTIRTLAEDKLIGMLDLEVTDWPGRDAFVGIGIGETEYWSKGYGTDAMDVLLRFAFSEVNLQRVTLTVFEYNPRAIRSYEKAGFRHEGRLRQVLSKEGRRWDELFMGILREEWLEQNQHPLHSVPGV